MKRVISVVALVLLVLAGTAHSEPLGCSPKPGKARWAIKTSIVHTVSSAQFVDLSDLLAFPNAELDMAQKRGLATGRMPRQDGMRFKEGDMIVTEGTLDLVKCSPDDDDFHIQIRTKDDETRCMIVEVPNGRYVSQPGLGGQVDKVRAFIRNTFYGGKKPKGKLDTPVRVSVTGQLFYDATHDTAADPGGRRGSGGCKAVNLWELHPVVKIGVVQ